MLVRTVKQHYDNLRGAAQQLLIWTLSRKQEFHCSYRYEKFTSDKNAVNREKFEDDDIFDENNNAYSRQNNWSKNENWNARFQHRKWSNDFSRKRRDRFNNKWLDNSNSVKKEVSLDNLKEFKKNFYNPHPDVLNRSEDEIQEFQRKHEIQLFGKNMNCPRPVFNFNELNLPKTTLEIISKLNYLDPTPIQSMTWPIALSGFDMVGVAQTGSGKTLAFVLPGMIHVQNQPPLSENEGPIALILCPTRELAKQINHVVIPFAQSYSFRSACIFGGSEKGRQRGLLKSAEVCVATPGRLIDFLEEGSVNMRRCTYFVLDEADLLMDMGFEPQIRQIISYMRKDKQVLMWSATWPKEVKYLAADFLKDYIGVKFGSSELTANPNITQKVHVCSRSEKKNLLLKVLGDIMENKGNKVLIYCQTKDDVEFMKIFLLNKGYKAQCIHGGKSQNYRDNAMQRFRKGFLKILIGTAVVGRGLDIHDISHVIIYDFPNEIEGYVHIIGRTGRANNSGMSHVFITEKEASYAADLIKILKECNQEVDPELEDLAHSMYKGKKKIFNRYRKY